MIGLQKTSTWSSVLLLTILSGCTQEGARKPGAEKPLPPTPAAFQNGDSLFQTHCANCHGMNVDGTPQGPPLTDPIYAPNHHADIAFIRAVEFGVRAHHWRFGNMPPISGLTTDQVSSIIAYVRWAQQQE